MFTYLSHTMSACALLAAAALFCSPPDAAAMDRPDAMRLSVSLVKVEALDADGRIWLGTGVYVSADHVVTSCHVTRRAESIKVQYQGRRAQVTAQSADTEHDLCILLVPGLTAQAVKLGAAGALGVGATVWALGFEGGYALQARAGVVRALHEYDGGRVVESTTPFTSGASGGALFDANGHLVGILTYRLRGDRRSYFSVPVEWFVARLAADRDYLAIAPLEGAVPFWQRPQQGLPFFLRAHQLETGRDWDGLLSLTDEWARAEDGNAEAWLFRGKSLAENRDPGAARLAFQRALALDPIFSAAWLELGRLSALHGLTDEAEDALLRLNHLNPELAQCLAVEMQSARGALPADNPVLDACSAI
jgi:serine protease Do